MPRAERRAPVDGTRPAGIAVAAATGADAVWVLVFCAVGRRSHEEGLTVAGLVETAWPFLAGLGAAWLAVLVARWRPAAPAPTGVTVWLGSLVIGMLLRRAASQGTAVSFVVVAAIALAIGMLGWRGAASLRRR